MKNLVLTISAFLLSFHLFAQNGQIISITTSPVNPTTNDFVKVYVDLVFNSGGCDVDNQGNSTTGNTTTAYAMHCVGMLTVICDVTDTFDLGYLQAGNHTFNFTLSSGSGGAGCSPGIVPDDTDNLSFTVTQALGIEDPTKNENVTFFPNPMSDFATIKINGYIESEKLSLEILDAAGRMVMTKESISSNEILIENKNLESGIYFYRMLDNGNLLAVDKFVVE
jgi:hypothetical protein